jgi:hypothetical protein
LRKSFLVAGVATLALGVTGVAIAQEPTSTVDVTVKPNKAGTTKKPRPIGIKLKVENALQTQTAAKLKIQAPKEVSFSLKDFKKCKASTLEAQGPSACPSASQVGPKGVAHAMAGVNGSRPARVEFEVTPFATGSKTIGFYLSLSGGSITGLAVGKISGRTLTVDIPETPAQQYPKGSYNALIDLTAQFWVKRGKGAVQLKSCPKSKKLTFKNTITFVNSDRTADGVLNPTPPSPATSTASGTGTCKK